MSRELRKDRIELQRRQIKQLRELGAPTYQHAHRLVAEAAKGIAAEFYERAARDDAFYNHYPSMKFFVEREWHLFIKEARSALGKMLAMPNYSETMKEQIHEALVADRTLPRPDNVYGR